MTSWCSLNKIKKRPPVSALAGSNRQPQEKEASTLPVGNATPFFFELKIHRTTKTNNLKGTRYA
jgi:hypothetical protein